MILIRSKLRRKLGFREILSYNGFLTDALKNSGATVIIRGLRDGYDLNYEFNQLRFLEDTNVSIPTFFIACDAQYSHLSSSALRSIGSLNQREAKKYIPEDLEVL